ncbi:MAG: TerB family tellurite resistance protein [Cyclobacteriaceae bacterium]|nr:TerB family tellurite resistance protein [Cyclobacteriaceae bacterium]
MDAVLRKKINILIHLAGADGHFDDSERAFIYNICLRHGVDLETIGDLIANPEPIGSLGALSHASAVDYLTESILLMLVDGKVLPSEILFCQEMGIHLGFPKLAVDELIEEIREDLHISYDDLHMLVEALPHPSKESA